MVTCGLPTMCSRALLRRPDNQPDGTTGQVQSLSVHGRGHHLDCDGTQPFTAGQADITFNRQQAGQYRYDCWDPIS